MGGAALGLGLGGEASGGRPSSPAAGDGPGLRHPSGARRHLLPPAGCSAGEPGGVGGTRRGRERDAIRVAAAGRLGQPPPHSGRALPRRWRRGEAAIFSFSFFWSRRGVGAGRDGACVCPFKSRRAAPASQAPGASQKNRMLLICHQTTERK